jgi:hypothetical protein
MRFAYFSREIAGWLLVAAGMWMFWNTYNLLLIRRVFTAVPTGFVAFIIFRGGVHLLKVAVAAQAARSLPETSALPLTRKASRMPAKAVGPTPVKSVLPGPRSREASANGLPD